MSKHHPGCWASGPEHYECAVRLLKSRKFKLVPVKPTKTQIEAAQCAFHDASHREIEPTEHEIHETYLAFMVFAPDLPK